MLDEDDDDDDQRSDPKQATVGEKLKPEPCSARTRERLCGQVGVSSFSLRFAVLYRNPGTVTVIGFDWGSKRDKHTLRRRFDCRRNFSTEKLLQSLSSNVIFDFNLM